MFLRIRCRRPNAASIVYCAFRLPGSTKLQLFVGHTQKTGLYFNVLKFYAKF